MLLKKHKLYIAVTTAASILLLICSVYLFTVIQNLENESVEPVETDPPLEIITFSQDEVDEFMSSAAKTSQDTMLSSIKSELSSGTSAVSLFRELFPEYIIYHDTDHYVFAPILDSVPKNDFTASDFSVDDKNEITYSPGGQSVSKKGIDVSVYQGMIDWEKVSRTDLDYAMIRVGYRGYGGGIITPDANFKRNIENANRYQVPVGVYFFSQAITEAEAVEEAQYVVDSIRGYSVEYPVVIDVEEILNDTYRQQDMTPEELTNICVAFCETVKSAGYTPMIYGNLTYFIGKLNFERLNAYKKWFAYYDTSLYFPYEISMWQYSDSGSIDGISGNVDLNISFETPDNSAE